MTSTDSARGTARGTARGGARAKRDDTRSAKSVSAWRLYRSVPTLTGRGG